MEYRQGVSGIAAPQIHMDLGVTVSRMNGNIGSASDMWKRDESLRYGRLVMAVKNTAQVVIGGKIMTLGGYESEEYFQKVASYINNKMSELSEMPGYSRQPMETKHTLLSLNVTDDYFKAKKQAEIFEQDLQQKDQEMYELKHELIALRMKIEETEQKEADARHQKELLEGKVKELEQEIDKLLK